MATYHIYKNKKVINIIEADVEFIKTLKLKGEIDEAVDVATIKDLKPLRFDEKKGCFVPNITVPKSPVQSLEPQISIYDMVKQIETLTKEVTAIQDKTNLQATDMQAALNSIKGFMMMMPDLQKSLREIKEVLASKGK
jgi:hypothetical protein